MLKKSLVPHSRRWIVVLLLAGNAFAATPETALRDAQRAVRLEDYARAYQSYSVAAKAGNVEAQYQLANLYRLGRGVAASAASERFWLEKAAAANHAGARYSLALELEETEPERATKLLRAASAAGYQPAVTYLQRFGAGGATKSGAGQSAGQSVQELWFFAARKNRTEALRQLQASVDSVDVTDAQQRTALLVAVQAGSPDTTSWLLRHGANPNRSDRFGKSAGFVAVDRNDPAQLKRLFGAGLDPKQTLPNGDSLLHYAIRRRADALVMVALDGRVPVNLRNAEGWTALDLARFSANEQAVALLTGRGAEPGAGWQVAGATSDGQASYWTGSEVPDLETLARITSAGNRALLRQLAADHRSLINRPLRDGRTLLAIAIANGQQTVVDTLLALGADPDSAVDGELTALQWAARSGQRDIALALLKREAQVTSIDRHGRDAIELALLSGHTALARELLVAASGTMPSGRLPLDRYAYTAARADDTDFVRVIGPHLQHSYQDPSGRNALWFAASHADVELVAALRRFGMTQDSADRDGVTPLLVAAQRGCLACLTEIANDADVNRASPSGDTPLIIAAARADGAMVDWLLANGADIHRRNALGDSALLVAVRADAEAVVRQLVAAGANASRKNKIGLSARDIAEKKGRKMMAALNAG